MTDPTFQNNFPPDQEETLVPAAWAAYQLYVTSTQGPVPLEKPFDNLVEAQRVRAWYAHEYPRLVFWLKESLRPVAVPISEPDLASGG